MQKNLSAITIIALALSSLAAAVQAAQVTMTVSPGLVRGGTATQGAGTYDAFDFYLSMGNGSPSSTVEFLNYRLIATATSGSFADPSRQQDDRQTEPQSGDANTANLGHIDTFASTVWRAVGKDTLALGSGSLTAGAGSYNPSGTGAAPIATTPITLIDWSISDPGSLAGDDNHISGVDDVNDGSVDQQAPYHIARILAIPGTSGSFEFRIFESDQLGVPEIFNFPISGPGLEVDDLDLGDVPRGTTVTATLPGGIDPSDWTLESFTGPNGAVTGASVDPDSGEFTWDSTGAPLGMYAAVIRDSHFEAGTDTGTLTFNLIPEPAVATLLGMAVFAAAGIRRRRVE